MGAIEETTGGDEATTGTSTIADEDLITTTALPENSLAATATCQEAEIARLKTGGVERVVHQLDRPADALLQEVAALRAAEHAHQSLNVVDTLQIEPLNHRSDRIRHQEVAAVVITIDDEDRHGGRAVDLAGARGRLSRGEDTLTPEAARLAAVDHAQRRLGPTDQADLEASRTLVLGQALGHAHVHVRDLPVEGMAEVRLLEMIGDLVVREELQRQRRDAGETVHRPRIDESHADGSKDEPPSYRHAKLTTGASVRLKALKQL